MKTPLILSALLLSATAATAQTVTIYEPVTLPYEYTDAGIIKAQHIKPGDVTPEEYQRLLDEADKVRAFQSQGTIAPEYGISDTTVFGSASTDTPAGTIIAPAEPTVTYETALTSEAPSGRIHTVVKGDTLYNISKRYGVGVTQIQDANELSSAGISLGQTLRIPSSWSSTVTAPTVVTEPVSSALNTQADVVLATTDSAKPYAVVPGDTLYSISRRACVGVDALKAVNGMGGNAIQPGQKLTLPGGHCLK